MQILSKMSVKTLCNRPKAFFKQLTGKTALMRVVGIARNYEAGQSTFGDFFKFKGEFIGTDLETGEQSMSSALFLPSPTDTLLKAQIDALKEAGNGDSPVEFAFDIFAIPDDSEVGFQYRIESLTETKSSDPLAALVGRVAAPKLAHMQQVADKVISDDSEVGFQYRIESLTETKSSDPLAHMQQVADKVIAVAEPTEAQAEVQEAQAEVAPKGKKR